MRPEWAAYVQTLIRTLPLQALVQRLAQRAFKFRDGLVVIIEGKRLASGNEWIAKKGYIFTDSGQSGLTVNSGLKDLMRVAAIDPNPFAVLLCASTYRIARDTSLSIQIHEVLKKYGVEIRFAEISDSQI